MKPEKLLVSAAVAALIRSLHPEIKKKIKTGLKLILNNPHEGKELREELSGLRSLRVSRFRIIYEIKDGAIAIVAVGPRKTIYEETLKLVKRDSAKNPRRVRP